MIIINFAQSTILYNILKLLLGVGKAKYKDECIDATEALQIAGLKPLKLAAKEGLALLNGTQVSTAFALRGLFEGEDLFADALVCGSLTVEAVLGSRSPYDARVHNARPHRGQIEVCKIICTSMSRFSWN